MKVSCCAYGFEYNCMCVWVCEGVSRLAASHASSSGCVWRGVSLLLWASRGQRGGGVRATLLLLTGSQAEAPALSIKPITHSQLTPDNLSAYSAWRLRANRQRQRCRWGLCYWKRGWRLSETDYECSALFQLRSQRWEHVVGERTLNLWLRRAPGASIQ